MILILTVNSNINVYSTFCLDEGQGAKRTEHLARGRSFKYLLSTYFVPGAALGTLSEQN